MSLNWKEINLILDELDLAGMQIQRAEQGNYDILCLNLYGKKGAKKLLFSISPGAARLHETAIKYPKNKILRFPQFLNSKITGGRIKEALQLGHDRIIRLTIQTGNDSEYPELRLYARLWSNAANIIVTDMEGNVLDAMKRLPKKGEISGGIYKPEITLNEKMPEREYEIRNFDGISFNGFIDEYYREERSSFSLESLREEAKRKYEAEINRTGLSVERLKEKEKELKEAENFRLYGELILANLNLAKEGMEWLEADNYLSGKNEKIRIKLDPEKTPLMQAEYYFEQYKKAKSGMGELQNQIEQEEKKLKKFEDTLKTLLEEEDPLLLYKKLRPEKPKIPGRSKVHINRPGLSYYVNDWLIIIGREAQENDVLLRKHVNGNDLWLHSRDYPGSYVFIKHRSGKTVPLDILLDAGNLALFYSKGRNRGEGDLFYTQVKYLRRAKNVSNKPGSKNTGGKTRALVIPTQEKNIHIKIDEQRLKRLEEYRLSRD